MAGFPLAPAAAQDGGGDDPAAEALPPLGPTAPNGGAAGAAQTPLHQMGEAQILSTLAAADPLLAQRIDRELRARWDRSGSPAMDLLLRRGRDALERGELGLALDHLTALTDHAPDFATGWAERAKVFFIGERYGPSVADLERALALNPNDYEIILGLGHVLEFFEMPERAHEVYMRAKAIHPHHEEVTKALDRLSQERLGPRL